MNSTVRFQDIPARLLYPKREAATLLGISKRSVDHLISAKRLASRRVGKRNLIPLDELKRFARGDRPEFITKVKE
jgi:excisionase family DNA binding protein